MGCVRCGGLILLPDLDDPDDLGHYHEPHKDFDPHPDCISKDEEAEASTPPVGWEVADTGGTGNE